MFDDLQKDPFTGKYVDVLGRSLSPMEVKRRVLAKNKKMGKASEDEFRFFSEIQCWEIERTPHGKDFIRRKRDLLTNKVIRTEHVEIKSGNAKLSKLQKKVKGKKSNYKLIRRNPWDFW